MSDEQLQDENAPSPAPTATTAIAAHIARLQASMERIQAEQRVKQKIEDFVAKENAARVAQKIAKERAEWDLHLKEIKDSLAKPPVAAAAPPPAHGGVMSIMQPSPAQIYLRPRIGARDTDGLRPGPPTLFSDTTTLIQLALALTLLAFGVFARRRIAWLVRQIISKTGGIIRWIRMEPPGEI